MSDDVPVLRQRGQLLPIVLTVIVVAFTLSGAVANMMMRRRATVAELRADELRTVVSDRRDLIVVLQATGDGCRPVVAHELVRALAFDGQATAAHAYADDYERRCGIDPVVRQWGDAPVPRAHRR
jgi:hypothetical protein